MKRLLLLLLVAVSTKAVGQPHIDKCIVFPADNIWNTPITSAPVHARSATYVNTIGADLSLRNDFGSGLWNGAPIGIPYVLVGASIPKQTITFDYADESDKVGYPVPENPPIEGGNNSTGDRHVLIVDTTTCTLYELYHVYYQTDHWTAGSGAVFDLTSNALRPDTWTSADAAGLPILPGLVRYDEVASGSVNHMIRFTVPKTSKAYLWPARHYASSITDPAYPPMGLVMRLKSTFDTSKLKPQSRVIARALMTYGMILADNGSAWYMSGVPDDRWDMDDLYTLRQIHGRDFDAVDLSSFILNNSSAKVRTTTSVDELNLTASKIHVTEDAVELLDEQMLLAANTNVIRLYDQRGNALPLSDFNVSRYNNKITVNTSGLVPGLYVIQMRMYAATFVRW